MEKPESSNGDESNAELEDRDPNSLNQHLQVMWDDVIGEPEGIRSPECAWRLSGHCFRLSRGCCYVLLSVLIAPLLALCFGFTFACLAFQLVGLDRKRAVRMGIKESIFAAHMVCSPLPSRLENHLRSHKKFSRCGDASHRATCDGLHRLLVPQYSCLQSENTGWSTRQGRSPDCVSTFIFRVPFQSADTHFWLRMLYIIETLQYFKSED